MTIAIQRASSDDLQDILTLQRLAFQREAEAYQDNTIEPMTQTIEELRREYAQGVILKALDSSGKLIGSVRGMDSGGSVLIHKLMVHPEAQGQGVGTQLMAAIQRECPAARYELSVSTRCPRTIAFYRRLGFVPFREIKTSDNNGFLFLHSAF